MTNINGKSGSGKYRGGQFPDDRHLSIIDRLCLIWGGPRRWFLGRFLPSYTARKHAERRGKCNNCGVCCRMSWICSKLVFKDGKAACNIYNGTRKVTCKVFPVNEMDLADRNRVAPHQPCGFYWGTQPETDTESPGQSSH